MTPPDESRPKIQHSQKQFGDTGGPGPQPSPPQDSPPPAVTPKQTEPMPLAEPTAPTGLSPKIRSIGEKDNRHEDEWTRTPNTNGTGAIHVRTFHSKLTDDALAYMDNAVNEWLDAHPQYEVKLVTSTVGTLTGKLKEPHLICQIWV
jgi:hypothetical protein